MSKKAGELLEQFRKMAASEQRELFAALLQELTAAPGGSTRTRRKSVSEIAGKYRPRPSPQAATHDAGFSEAVAASKRD